MLKTFVSYYNNKKMNYIYTHKGYLIPNYTQIKTRNRYIKNKSLYKERVNTVKKKYLHYTKTVLDVFSIGITMFNNKKTYYYNHRMLSSNFFIFKPNYTGKYINIFFGFKKKKLNNNRFLNIFIRKKFLKNKLNRLIVSKFI